MLRARQGGGGKVRGIVGRHLSGSGSTFILPPAYFLPLDGATLTPSIGTGTPTVTRAGNTGTRINSSGLIEVINANLPRFDYDPVTLLSRGLLVEEARTNLCIQSQALATTWTQTGSPTVTNAAAIGLDGASTASKLVASGANSYVTQDVTISGSAGTTTTISAYFKKDNVDFVRFRLSLAGVTKSAYFNINTGVTSTVDGVSGNFTALTAGISAAGNGWYRCTAYLTSTTTTTLSVGIVPAASAGANSAATDSVYVFGVQIEAGAFPTSYIPTTTVSVTRAVDAVSLATASLSGYSASTGTLYAKGEVRQPASSATPLVSLDDGTTNERMQLRRGTAGTEWGWIIVDGGVVQANASNLDNPVSATAKAVLAYTLNDSAACVNGGTVSTDAACTMPTPTTLGIGQGAGLAAGQAWISAVAYWPTRLTNTQLAVLTAL